jgi:hypothetical protein
MHIMQAVISADTLQWIWAAGNDSVGRIAIRPTELNNSFTQYLIPIQHGF